MRVGGADGEALLDKGEADRALEGEEGAEERTLTAGQLEHEPRRLGRQLTQLFPSLTHEHRRQGPFRLQAQQLGTFERNFGRPIVPIRWSIGRLNSTDTLETQPLRRKL